MKPVKNLEMTKRTIKGLPDRLRVADIKKEIFRRLKAAQSAAADAENLERDLDLHQRLTKIDDAPHRFALIDKWPAELQDRVWHDLTKNVYTRMADLREALTDQVESEH